MPETIKLLKQMQKDLNADVQVVNGKQNRSIQVKVNAFSRQSPTWLLLGIGKKRDCST